MTMKLEQAARQALEALETLDCGDSYKTHNAATALREALRPEVAPDGRVAKTVFTLDDMTKAFEEGRKNGRTEALAEQAEQEPDGIVWDASAPVVMDSSSPKNKNKEVAELRKQVAALKAVVDAWNNVEQEPVAWVVYTEGGDAIDCVCTEKPRLNKKQYSISLYSAPVHTKDLTDDEIQNLRHKIDWTAEWSYVNFARAVIAADREKNK